MRPIEFSRTAERLAQVIAEDAGNEIARGRLPFTKAISL